MQSLSVINNPDVDTDAIKEIALTLANNARGLRSRYFLKSLAVNHEPRVKVLRGFRGVGKTTALLQLMSATEKSLYFSMDHPIIQGFRLYDLCKQLIRLGYETLFIDEIHHYPNWKSDTKALYDEFPKLALVLSGSAPLAFEPERRYAISDVEPLSLAESLELGGQSISLPAGAMTWQNPDSSLEFLAANPSLYAQYDQYLRGSSFPIWFTYKEKTLEAVYGSIRKSIREDAPFFSKVDGETIRGMERLLLSLASSKVGELSINGFSNLLELKKHKAYEIVSLLEQMRILRIVRPYGRGPKLVRGDPKLLFHHPTLRFAICNALNISPDVGALREELAAFCLTNQGWAVYSIKGQKRNPDFLIEKRSERYVVEIGGPSKSSAQLVEFKTRFKTLVLTDRQLITLALFR